MNIDTPRTQELRDDLAGIASEAPIWKLFKKLDCRQLERELTAVTEQRDELLRYNEAFRKETLICADCDAISKGEYDQAIEQRDRLQKIVDEQCRVSSVCREYREQRDRLAEALELFLSRVQYNSVFMDGKPRGGTFDYRSSGFDGEVEHAYKALAAVKGDKV